MHRYKFLSIQIKTRTNIRICTESRFPFGSQNAYDAYDAIHDSLLLKINIA